MWGSQLLLLETMVEIVESYFILRLAFLFFLTLKMYLVYLQGRVTETEGEAEISHLLAYSTHGHNGSAWLRSKPGACSFTQVSTQVAGAKTPGLPCIASPGTVTWNWRRPASDTCIGCPSWWFNLLPHNARPCILLNSFVTKEYTKKRYNLVCKISSSK